MIYLLPDTCGQVRGRTRVKCSPGMQEQLGLKLRGVYLWALILLTAVPLQTTEPGGWGANVLCAAKSGGTLPLEEALSMHHCV